jgi:hypothetical protein
VRPALTHASVAAQQALQRPAVQPLNEDEGAARLQDAVHLCHKMQYSSTVSEALHKDVGVGLLCPRGGQQCTSCPSLKNRLCFQ